jgi:hypothetical protein
MHYLDGKWRVPEKLEEIRALVGARYWLLVLAFTFYLSMFVVLSMKLDINIIVQVIFCPVKDKNIITW